MTPTLNQHSVLTWLHMRLDSLVRLVQASIGVDDVKSRAGPGMYPDLLQPM